MNHDFTNKMTKLAEIVEQRDESGAGDGSIPTKFTFITGKNGLELKWTPSLTPPEVEKKLFEVHVPKRGFSYQDWAEMTSTLYDIL